ncbi:MAG: lipopolysaccharide transport system permease protein [Planctomycetota bacterium]|jgi:lipopolysaccharide transport system permease protein
MAFLLAPFRSAWQHRKLLRALSVREISTSFKGSFIGLGWLVLQPLATLAVYAFVFGGLLYGGGDMQFVSQLFTGLIIFQAFSELVQRAPRLVVSRPSYVTKIVFPLDMLPWPVAALASVHAAASMVMLLILHTLFVGVPSWTVIAMPIVVTSVLLLGLSISWILSSIGVYVRDTQEIVRVVMQMLFFLSPIVWKLEVAQTHTPALAAVAMYNPLAIAMETSRALIDNTHPAPGILPIALLFGGSLVFAGIAHAFFRRTKSGFADVL